MSACNTFRSFAICWIIAIITTQSPTSGFTIRRTNIVDGYEPDLSAEESSLLEVKHDLKRPNDIKPDSYTKIDGIDEILGPENIRNKSIASKNEFSKLFFTTTESESDITTQDESTTEAIETTNIYNKEEAMESTIGSTTSSNEITSNAPDAPKKFVQILISTSSANISSPEDVSELETKKSSTSPYTETENKHEDTTSTFRKPEEVQSTTTNIPKLIITGVLNFQSNTVTKSDNYLKNGNLEAQTDFVKFISETLNNKLKNNLSEVTTSTNFVSTNAAEDSLAKPSVTVDTTIDNNNDITSTKYISEPEDLTSFSSEASQTPLKINRFQFQIAPTTAAIKADATSQPMDMTDLFSEVMAVEQTSSVMAEPLMKTYTGIDRKRKTTTTDENIFTTFVNHNELVTADSTQTRDSLEKKMSATPLPVLEKQRLNLMSIPTRSSMVSRIEGEDTQQTKDSQSTFGAVSITRSPKREMVSSMRAGFLDLTAKTAEPLVSTAAENIEALNVDNEQTFETDKDIESDTIGNTTANGMQTQSQLTEDAINEELLKERTIHDNEENAKRYYDEAFNAAGTRLLDESSKESNTSQDYTIGDSLRVKPISQDKSKLYTVNSNYKPMKKIDVQPSKQFVRDPDDNSWRNESISSLGIVFKPKNSSKSFTQVLKNKTEFTNISDRNKNDLPELRERLEKIAEVRKSKKKRIDKFGETIYTDYEENSASGEIPIPKVEIINIFTEAALLSTSIRPTPSRLSNEPEVVTTETTSSTDGALNSKQEGLDVHATKKPKKFYSIAEYYDSADEYDADYVHLSKLDLKKFRAPFKAREPAVTQPGDFPQTKSTYSPNRKATLQYFPPRPAPKIKNNDYHDNFQKNVNVYPYKHIGISFGTVPTLPVQTNNIEPADREYSVRPLHYTHVYKPVDITKNLYLTSPPRSTDPLNGNGNTNDEYFNRPLYAIKHFNQDFASVTKDNIEDKTPAFLFTEPPVKGATIKTIEKSVAKIKLPSVDDYDYDSQFRKDILNRFVDNFNQNSENYKVDFPILFNHSVVHSKSHENGKSLASSSALMKRLYNDMSAAKVNNYFVRDKPCDPHCDNITVELSPAYELHYYVPDQEEKEEIEETPSPPYRYRL